MVRTLFGLAPKLLEQQTKRGVALTSLLLDQEMMKSSHWEKKEKRRKRVAAVQFFPIERPGLSKDMNHLYRHLVLT